MPTMNPPVAQRVGNQTRNRQINGITAGDPQLRFGCIQQSGFERSFSVYDMVGFTNSETGDCRPDRR